MRAKVSFNVDVDQHQRIGRWLAGFGIAVVIGMQAGTAFRPLGMVGDTRWADWIDLLTPWAVLSCAAVALVAGRARLGAWVTLAAGAVLFTQGHGLHLAANSVANVAPSPVAHLWDEVASHYLWYLGLAVVVAALVAGLTTARFSVTPAGYLLTALVAVTLFDTFVEGGTALLGLVLCAVFIATGWRLRASTVGRLLLVVYVGTAVLLVGWGAYWWGFPQFSELGWI